MIIHHQIVNGLLLGNGQVLVARRSVERRTYPDCWSFPGGHVEAGESTEQALIRELREELGVTPNRFHMLETIQDNSDAANNYEFHMFAVTEWAGQPTIQDDEHSILRWLPFDQAAQLEDLALDQYVPLLQSLGTGD